MEKEKAIEQGYGQITYPYKVNEKKMLHRACQLLGRGNVDYVLVEEKKGTSIWRKDRAICYKPKGGKA